MHIVYKKSPRCVGWAKRASQQFGFTHKNFVRARPNTEISTFYRPINIDSPVKSQRQDLLIQYNVLCRWILRYILYIKSSCGCFYRSLNINNSAKSISLNFSYKIYMYIVKTTVIDCQYERMKKNSPLHYLAWDQEFWDVFTWSSFLKFLYNYAHLREYPVYILIYQMVSVRHPFPFSLKDE